MPNQEILPPVRIEPIRTNVPTVRVGGPVSSAVDTFIWNRRAKAVDALTNLNKSEVALYQAQTELIEQARKRETQLFEWQEDREKFAHGLQIRRVERLETYCQAWHVHETAEMRRTAEKEHYEKEIINARTVRTLAQVSLADAEQQLSAQRDLGEITYRIAHRKKQHELLDLDLLEADKRELLKETRGTRSDASDDDDVINQALARAREELAADNLDTSRIDAAIRARR